MVLLLQLNGELPDRFPGHERRLYVFACRNKSCRRKQGSIRALRGLRVSPDAPAAKPKSQSETKVPKPAPAPKAAPSGLGEAIFGVKAPGGSSGQRNPFAAPSGSNPFSKPSSVSANPFSKPAPGATQSAEKAPATEEASSPSPSPISDLPKTFAETLSLNNTQVAAGPPPPAEPWPAESDQPAAYPISWLAEADYETLDPTPMPKYITEPISMEIDSGDAGGSGGKEDKEVFESNMDSVFQKFADRVGQNPEQCIRYEYAGQPLLYSKNDAVGKQLHLGGEDGKIASSRGIPRCQNCGAARVFEVQLTPHVIEELESEEDSLDGMDWGTIIIGVCEKNCQEVSASVGATGYLEEWAGVQWEELTAQR